MGDNRVAMLFDRYHTCKVAILVEWNDMTYQVPYSVSVCARLMYTTPDIPTSCITRKKKKKK